MVDFRPRLRRRKELTRLSTSQINLYKEAEETPYHQQVLDWHVPRMLKEVREEANYEERKAAVDAWNEKHRYRKRGISLIPTKFGLAFGLRSMNQVRSAFSLRLPCLAPPSQDLELR